VPTSGYDVGGGMEVVVIYTDEETIALTYTREDSAAVGYTIHVDKVDVAPNLLTLYKELDDPNGPRYVYPNKSYDLPSLPAGQPFGTAKGTEIVVAIVDTGTCMDTRSCDEWWQIRPGYTGGLLLRNSHLRKPVQNKAAHGTAGFLFTSVTCHRFSGVSAL
jgi:hypothetical protein